MATADPAGGALAGRAALVTGGGSGIGRATAQALSAAGASVLVADRNRAGAEATAAEIDAAGGRAVAAEVDVTDAEAVAAMVAAALDALGRLDACVNNAGTSGTYGPLADLDPDRWRATLDVNLTGVFLCLRAEAPVLLAEGGGTIVNVASAAGLMGFAHLPDYVASKHGVIGLTKSAALKYASRGVRVNAVCPGSTRTPMLAAFAGSDEVLEGMGRAQPMRRLGTPDEVAQAVVWLCSDASSYVTGHALAVDGGVLAT